MPPTSPTDRPPILRFLVLLCALIALALGLAALSPAEADPATGGGRSVAADR